MLVGSMALAAVVEVAEMGVEEEEVEEEGIRTENSKSFFLSSSLRWVLIKVGEHRERGMMDHKRELGEMGKEEQEREERGKASLNRVGLKILGLIWSELKERRTF